VDSDLEAITTIRKEETQAGNDRRLALSIGSGDLITCESPPTDDQDSICDFPLSKSPLCIATQLSYCDEDYQESEVSGPSMTYKQRQEEMAEKLNTKIQCCVCYDSSPPCKMIQLKNCSHIYCADCLKSLFLRATKDQSLFPPSFAVVRRSPCFLSKQICLNTNSLNLRVRRLSLRLQTEHTAAI
jgi:hypothetical protein